MEQSEVENIQKEISTKIKLPKEEKQKIYKKIFVNLLIALSVLIYFIFLNLGYMRLEKEVFENDLKVFAVILMCSTIYFIEKAYKTDRGTYLSYAIELFVLSIITLYMPYVYYYQNTLAQLIFTTSAVYIFIYYAIKSIVIYVINKNRYIKGESDVKDIIKDEKVSYLDEESSKKFENANLNEDYNRQKEIEKEYKEKQRIKTILKNNMKTSDNYNKKSEDKEEKSNTKSKAKSNTKSKSNSKTKKKATKKEENEKVIDKKDKEEKEEIVVEEKSKEKPKSKSSTSKTTTKRKKAKTNSKSKKKETKETEE